jgi:hypothetical protein
MHGAPMPKERPQAPVEDDPELAEFASLEPMPPADLEFRERLRAELWSLLEWIVADD